MILLTQALEIFNRQTAGRTVESHSLPVKNAMGYTLASNVTSKIDIPPFNRSAMDGYAVIQGDSSSEFVIRNTIRAGQSTSIRLSTGECVKIMTGAPVPETAGRVIPVEHTVENDGIMRVISPSQAIHISRQGEDITAGSRIARAGDLIDEVLVSILISCGVETVDVFRRVRAAVISTGDELVDSMKDYVPGKIFDSNGPMLVECLKKNHAEVTLHASVSDDPHRLESGIRNALRISDIVFLTGGVSAGEFDYVADVLGKLNMPIHFSRVRIKPGKPVTFASNESGFVLALPGNPVSAFLMFHVFGSALIGNLQNRSSVIRWFPVPLNSEFKRKSVERLEFIPARITSQGCISPVVFHGSAHFDALRQIDGFFTVDPEVQYLPRHQTVPFWPLRVKSFAGDDSE